MTVIAQGSGRAYLCSTSDGVCIGAGLRSAHGALVFDPGIVQAKDAAAPITLQGFIGPLF